MINRIFFLFVILILSSGLLVQAQTPGAAINHYEHGAKRFQIGNLDGAIEDFTKAIEISSRLGSDRPARGQFLPGADGLAAPDAEAAGITVIDPFTARAYTGRGLARYRKGDIEGAMADWNRAIRISPGLAEAYLDRGSGRYASGDTAGAVADWNRAIQINPRLSFAYSNRGAARQELGDVAGALADLNEAIRLDLRDATPYCHRGFVWLEKLDFDRAIADFNKALEFNPRMAQAYLGRGDARICRLDLETAIADFGHALELDPNLANAYLNRGLALLLQGKETEAEKDFERCRALKMGDDLERRINLARRLVATTKH